MKNRGLVDFLPFGNRDRLKLLASNRMQKSRRYLPPSRLKGNSGYYELIIRSVAD
jgi:hypothetical protein